MFSIFIGHVSTDPAAVALFVQPFEAPVLEGLYHLSSMPCRLEGVK